MVALWDRHMMEVVEGDEEVMREYEEMVEEGQWSDGEGEDVTKGARSVLPSSAVTTAASCGPSLLSVRWALLFPHLYQRVDLPGLRGFAVVELLVIFSYLSVNAYYLSPLLHSFVAPQQDFSSYMVAMVRGSFRLGVVGTWNVLALWLPITRHSIWNYFLGISFDRALFYHIWISRLALAVLTLHGVGLFAWMCWKGQLWKDLSEGGVTGKVPSGSIALLGGLILVATSVAFVRRRWWELFIRCHYVGLIVFTVFSLLHDRMVLSVTIAGVALFGVDCLIRCFQWSRPVQVLDLRVMTGGRGDISRLEWRMSAPSSLASTTASTSSPTAFHFSPGQFVLVCIPLLSPFEWHPYSISSSPHHPTVVLHSQRKGKWTTRLEALAKSFDPAHPFRMYVEGPYGALTLPLPRYRHVMLVSGGLGVTPMLSVYHHLREGHRKEGEVEGRRQEGRGMEKVDFVWSMRDRGLIDSVWNDLERLYEATASTSPFTTASAPLPPSSPPSFPSSDAFHSFFHVTSSSFTGPLEEVGVRGTAKWSMANGRPPLNALFAAMKREMTAFKERTAAEDPSRPAGSVRCAVLVCGGEALIHRCRRLCGRHSDRAWRCGGTGKNGGCFFDLHEEIYQW